MELLLMLTYAAICIGVFKLFRIPVNKWTVPTAALGGGALIGALFVVMNYNHPYSESTRLYFPSIPMVPQVRGRIVEIPVGANEIVKEGTVLFRLDETPYRDKVEAVTARIKGATENRDYLKVELDRNIELQKQGASSDRETQRWRVEYEEAQATLTDLQSQLHAAQFDLDSTAMHAPADGVVTQLVVRTGMMAGISLAKPVMVFLPIGEAQLVGWFRQNNLLRLGNGDEAEVTFDAMPGQVFTARVKQVIPVIGEGQLVPSADLIEFREHAQAGRAPVLLEIEDPAFKKHRLPAGIFGQSAVYTEHAHHLALLRKILLRMASWVDYLFPFH